MTSTPNEPSGQSQAPPTKPNDGGPWIYAVFPIGMVFLYQLTWPARNVVLVYWVYGQVAYDAKGIRVLKGKPTRFSNGERVPGFPDFVTGMAAFFTAVLAALAVVLLARRIYVRIRGSARRRAA